MIAVAENPRARRTREQWRTGSLSRARLLAGILRHQERCRVEKLVESHLHLLSQAAGYWRRKFPSIPYEDLHSCAFPGLRRAAELFDSAHPSGATFSTWAFSSIRDAIQRELPSLLGIVRVPKHPTAPRPSVASFDDDAPEPEDEGTTCPVAAAVGSELRERVRSALNRLTPRRDAQVIAWHFGLDGPPLTLGEIAEALGCTAERVRQLESRALARLRGLLTE